MVKTKDKDKKEITHTKYEKARVIGSRALQISMGAPFLVKLTPTKLKEIGYNTVEIAKKEYEEGIIPITVKRPMPSSKLKKK